jgi:hypothetical protein
MSSDRGRGLGSEGLSRAGWGRGVARCPDTVAWFAMREGSHVRDQDSDSQADSQLRGVPG